MRYQPHVIASDKPISEINTTPIIDVMLVLIVVMLLSLPMQTHKLPIELPQAGPAVGKPQLVHKLALDAAGSVRWDGKTITTAQLDKKLAELAKDPAIPVLQMQTHAATPYVRFNQVLGAVRGAGVGQIGFVGNDAFREF